MKILLLAMFLIVGLAGAQKPLPVNGGDQHKQAQGESNDSKPDIQAIVAAEVRKENAANAQKYAYYKAHPKEYFRDAFAPANLSNWILAGLGVIGGVIAVITLVTFKRQTDHMIASERAWIKAIIHNIEILRGAPPIGVVVGLKNGGKTPGFVFEIGNVIEILKTKESLPATPREYPPETVFRWEEPGLPLAPEDSHGKWVLKTAQDTERIFNGEDVLWVRGYVKYHDAFSNELRETHFCFRWIPPRPDVGINAQFLIEGPPAYHRMT
jgi:hypothetical protein